MTKIDFNLLSESVDKSVLCWLATIDSDGFPNVSPKEIFAVKNNVILIANIASPESLKNVLANPKVCVSFIDVFVQKGHKVKGKASIITSDTAEFKELSKPLVERTKGLYPFASIFKINLEKVSEIKAPSYFLFPKESVAQKVMNAMKTYNVRPIND